MKSFTSEADRKEYIALFILLAILGVLLLSTSVEGPFIIDEINYLVTAVGLRQGVMTVPGTENLTPSPELFAFDPDPKVRIVGQTPVYSVAPPLYGLIALPFLELGWRGLVLINTFSFLIAGLAVFLLARRYTTLRHSAWIALLLVLAGGSLVEYAQGIWPHALSVALVTCSLLFVSATWENHRAGSALVGGILIGIAVGIREQNIVLLGGFGLTILLFGQRRWRSGLWFSLGAAIPLASIATMHYFRQGRWHPFPKVSAYASQVGQQVAGPSAFDPLGALWTRFVDFSAHPGFTDPVLSAVYRKDPESGAFLVDGVVKKALLQSSPWIVLALAVFTLVWLIPSIRKSEQARILKPLSILAAVIVALFTVTSVSRSDGLAYNQRYLLEIVPIAAIAVALFLDRLGSGIRPSIVGLVIAGLLFAGTLMLPSLGLFRLAILKVPLILAAAMLLGLAVLSHDLRRRWIPVLLAVCLGWSFLIQIVTDVPASRSRRARNAAIVRELEAHVPAHSAIFSYGWMRDAAGALVLERPVTVIDVGADDGVNSSRHARELMGQNRPVFVLGSGFPLQIMRQVAGGDSLAMVAMSPVPLYRLKTRGDAHSEVFSR